MKQTNSRRQIIEPRALAALRVTAWLVGLVILCNSIALSQPNDDHDQVSIRAVGDFSDYFGGKPTTIELELSSDANREIEVRWSIKLNSLTVIRRSATQNVTASKPHLFQIEFEAPTTKDGVVLPCTLEVDVFGPKNERLASYTKQIWFFAKDPFYENISWLKKLDITLVDPMGETTELLESLEVPFRKVVASQGNISKGMLIIGVGVRWNEVIEQLVWQAIVAGQPILCFAPKKGELRLGTLQARSSMPEVSLRNLSFISQLDKRLSPSRCESNGRCNIANGGGKLIVTISDKDDGWHFLELKDTKSSGHLILCCNSFDEPTSPTPRYLLAMLFERLFPNTIFNAELSK